MIDYTIYVAAIHLYLEVMCIVPLIQYVSVADNAGKYLWVAVAGCTKQRYCQ